MNELKITKEKVIDAANKCSSAKEVLKTLFPEVFKTEFDKNKIYAVKDCYNTIHKLHCIKDNWAFISLDNSCNISYRDFNLPEELIKHIENMTKLNVVCFNNQKEFLNWCLKNS
jgi:mRNA-degrading endonuclease HigB of HigAB toxin-antitoxin module